MNNLISNFSAIGGQSILISSKRYEDNSVAETHMECDICGSNHETKHCTFLPEEQTVSDSKALSRARLTLPPNLKVETLGDGSTAVKTLSVFKKGTRFGPMEAKKTRALNPFNTFPLKVFGRTERQTFYLDTSSENHCNWMCLVPGSADQLDNPATFNLMCYQMDGAIFYTTTRLVKKGEWLRVGYAPNYAVKMGVKPLVTLQDMKDEKEVRKRKQEADEKIRRQIVDQLSAKELGVPSDRVLSHWTCELCKQEFNKVDAYATHLREHYKPAANEPSLAKRRKNCRTCDSCNTKFKTRQLLLTHVCSRSDVAIGQLHSSSDVSPLDGVPCMEGMPGSCPAVPNETLDSLLQQYEAMSEGEVNFDLPPSFNPQQFLDEEFLLAKTPDEGKLLDCSLDVSNISLFGLDSGQEEFLADSIVIADNEQPQQQQENLFDLGQTFDKDVTLVLTDMEGRPIEASSLSECPTLGVYSAFPGPRSQTLACSICSKTFANKSNLARHMRKHSGDFVCTTCFVVFARKETLYNHKCDVDPSGRKFECDTCGKQFTRKSFLERHVASKHLGMWKCESCHTSYSSAEYLSTHACSALGKGAAPPQPHRCPFCNKCFTRRSYLTQHLRRHPTSQCRHCGKTLVNVERHESYCSQAANLEPDGLAECPECGLVIVDLVTFRGHALAHTHPWPCKACGARFTADILREEHVCSVFKCDVCPESFSTFSDFQEHSGSHGIPNHHCFECGISYHSLEGINSHLCTGLREVRKQYQNPRVKRANVSRLMVGGGGGRRLPPPGGEGGEEGRYVCDQCGRVFRLKASLTFHIQQHGGEKYQCHICDRAFERKDTLKNHYAVHQEPQVVCPQCPRRFKTAKNRDVHMRAHAGTGFPCHRCEATFSQKHNLASHMATHEPRLRRLLRRQCELCLAWLKNKYSLSQHMMNHAGRTEQCPVTTCAKKFATQALVKAHIKSIHLHGGFTCPYCDKTIRFRASIKRHLNAIHRDMKKEFQAPGFLDSLKSPPVEDELQDLLSNTVSAQEGPVNGEITLERDSEASNMADELVRFPARGANPPGNPPDEEGRAANCVTVKYVDDGGRVVDVLVTQLMGSRGSDYCEGQDVGLPPWGEGRGVEVFSQEPEASEMQVEQIAVGETRLNADDNGDELVWVQGGTILQLGNDNEISYIVVGSSEVTVDDGLVSMETVDSGLVISETVDSGLVISETVDSGLVSMEPVDSGLVSSETVDTGLVSMETVDDGLVSMETVDDGLVSSETVDSGIVSMETVDDGLVSSETVDSGLVSSETVDSGLVSMETVDTTGLVSSETVDSGLVSSETVDSGLVSSETVDSGLVSMETVDSGLVSMEPIDDGPVKDGDGNVA